MDSQHSKFEITFFVSVFVAVLVLCFFVLLPFLTTLAVAAVFAVLTYPLYQKIVGWVRYRSLAALITTVCVFVVTALPVALLGSMLFEEARSISQSIGNGYGDATTVVTSLEAKVRQYVPDLSLNVGQVVNQGVSWLSRNIGNAFSVTAQLVLSLVVGLIAYFFFLKDGARFLKTIVHMSPLGDKHDIAILSKLSNTIHSVIRGSLTIALIQGILTCIGFVIFGVPNPVLWGSVAAIGALVPGVGTTIVLLPAIIYLFASGSTGAGIGLLLWGVVAVGLIDNLLMPRLVGSRAKIHSLFILISVLGGLAFFGPSGFLLGPLVVSLVYGLAETYLDLFKRDIELASTEVSPS